MPEDAPSVDPDRIPRHVAIILDGNGRWANARGLPRTAGHAQGEPALFDVVHGALELGLEWLTVYTFSTENWSRDADEVAFLMEFNVDLLERRRDELDELGVRVIFIGDHVDLGFARGHLRQQCIDILAGLVGQQYRSGLGVQRLDLSDPVILLVRPGKLVPAYPVAVIVSHRGNRHQARLGVLAHHQPVDVVAVPAVALQYAFIQHVREILGRLAVDRRVMGIRTFGQVDLGPGDVQKTPRSSRGTLPRLNAVQDIIGRRDDIGSTSGNRPQAGKRSNQGHGGILRAAVIRKHILYTRPRRAATHRRSTRRMLRRAA